MYVSSKQLRSLSRRASRSVDPVFFLHALVAVADAAERQAMLVVHDIHPLLDRGELKAFKDCGGDLRILGQVMFAAQDLGLIERTVMTISSSAPGFHATTRTVWRSRVYRP